MADLELSPAERYAASRRRAAASRTQLAAFRERAVPQPAATARDEVVTTGAWAGLPAVVVCSSIPSQVVREMVEAGQQWVAALSHVEDLTYVDLATSHWPMWSRPRDLAEIIGDVARRAGASA